MIPTSNIIPQILRKRTNFSPGQQPYILKEIEPVSTILFNVCKETKTETGRKLEYVHVTCCFLKKGMRGNSGERKNY